MSFAGSFAFAIASVLVGVSSASAAGLCSKIFEARQENALPPFKYPSVEGGFTELNPWNARWTHHQDGGAKTHLNRDSENETVTFSGRLAEDSASETIEMHLDREWQVDLQTMGRGLGLHLTSSEPGLEVEIRIKGTSHVYDEEFSAVATVTTSGGLEKIVIPWDHFKMENQVRNGWAKATGTEIFPERHKNAKIVPDKTAQLVVYQPGESFFVPAFHTTSISFKVVRARETSAGTGSFQISLRGPLYRDFGFEWLSSKPLEFMLPNALYQSTQRGRYFQFLDASNVTDLYFSQLANEAAQNYAFDVIDRGEAAIRKELEKYSVEIRELNDKAETYGFFRGLSRRGENGQLILILPVESGSFALKHGRWTHVAQFLTAAYGLENSPRLENLKELFCVFNSATTSGGWHNIWNAFMEAPGDAGPHSVQWWVHEFKRRKIATEPASGL